MPGRISAVAVPIGVIGIVLLLIVPIPVALLDVLIIVNILFALVVLLTTMAVRRPLDFSVFPSLLLIATLFRLGLNVASTRLVLGEGHAGEVIRTFGEVTVGGSIVIGAVIFLILVVIQFVVVTKGAERVAEVGARFTLDAMPGKQMAIDADLNAGLITESQARERRAEISAEADFYGAMDGASKFVKGDAIAGIVIILINVVGGITVGMAQRGMEIGEAVDLYTVLTIGDGLVTQIPALLMAVSTGMIVTRSTADEDVSSAAARQLGQSRLALVVAGGTALALGLIPGMPIVAFWIIGIALLGIAARLRTVREREAERLALEERAAVDDRPETTEDIIEQMRVHALEVQLAPDVVDVVTGGADDLLARIKSLRRRLALDLGFVIPPVRTRDSVELPAATYAIRIAGVEVGRGLAPAGRVLALGDDLAGLPGVVVVEPVFGLPGVWVPAELRRTAELAGATVIDRVSVIVTHLSSLVTADAARLLSREDVRVLTEGVKEQSPALVGELTPAPLSLSEIHRVLQGLLAERVPINDLSRIYEALSLRARVAVDAEGLVEAARQALGAIVVQPHLDDGVLRVVTIDPVLEQSMLEGLRAGEAGATIVLPPETTEQVLGGFVDTLRAARERGVSPVVVCAPSLRPAVRRLLSSPSAAVTVLSYSEATTVDAVIETVGVIRADQTLPVAR